MHAPLQFNIIADESARWELRAQLQTLQVVGVFIYIMYLALTAPILLLKTFYFNSAIIKQN